jgi:hypothetical protein
LNQQPVQSCEGELQGAAVVGDELWVACSNEVIVILQSAELVETFDQFSALPIPIKGIGNCAQSICVESNQQVFMFDESSVLWRSYDGEVDWRAAAREGEKVPLLVPEVHNWERLILEAHSGRLFGKAGVLVMDLAALAILLLALSGCFVYWSHNRRRKLAANRSNTTESQDD